MICTTTTYAQPKESPYSSAGSHLASDSCGQPITLDGIEVKGHRPLVVNNGTIQTVTVKGSYLSKLGNLADVLRFMPGIIAKGGEVFEVAGKGSPAFYVDGVEVRLQNVMKIIKAGNIDRIIIDREPSSKYPAGTNAVVDIITYWPLKDMISLDLYYDAEMKRRFSQNPSFDFRLKKNRYATAIIYNYSMDRNLNRETYFSEIYHDDYLFRSDQSNENLMTTHGHRAAWMNEVSITENHRVFFNYFFQHTKDTDDNNEITVYDGGRYRDKALKQIDITYRNMHSLSLGYQGIIRKGHNINISADYAHVNSNSNAHSEEFLTDGRQAASVITSNRGDFDIFTLNAAYNFTLPFAVSSETGFRYYTTRHPYVYESDNPALNQASRYRSQQLKEQVSALYLSFMRRWKAATVKIGGRLENGRTEIDGSAEHSGDDIRSHHTDFLPSISLDFKPKTGWDILLTYNRSITRQGYLSMNPNPVYQDSLKYSSGNEELKPSVKDRYAVYLTMKEWVLSFSYIHTRNAIRNITFCKEPGSDILTEMPYNFPKSECFVVNLTYSRYIGNLSVYGTAFLSFPNDRFYFRGKEQKVTKPMATININLAYNFSDSFSLFSNFTYQGPNQQLNMSQKEACNWSAGLEKSFLDDRLNVSLSVSDILRKANYNNLSQSFADTRTGTYGTNDMRGVMLSVNYNLFDADIKVKSKQDNEDVLNRTNE